MKIIRIFHLKVSFLVENSQYIGIGVFSYCVARRILWCDSSLCIVFFICVCVCVCVLSFFSLVFFWSPRKAVLRDYSIS